MSTAITQGNRSHENGSHENRKNPDHSDNEYKNMIIINSKEFHIEEPCAVAIGKFDGIHLGHKALFEKLFKHAGHSNDMKTAVFTFNPSAAKFFAEMHGNNIDDFKEITTLAEKRIIFEKMGIDYLVEYPLDAETAAILPEDFVKDILLDRMNMKFIAAGYDLSFGYKGAGDVELLMKMASEYGFETRIIDKISFEGREISSTYLREEIQKGDMEKVTRLLGHPYSFAGRVEKGFKLGRTLGFPTMNLYPDEEKILPPLGVYYSEVEYEGIIYEGLTNIGMRPTVAKEGDHHISVETYLFDFDKDMYGKTIITRLIKYKRPEIRFSSKEELKRQIQQDLQDGLDFTMKRRT